MNQLQVLKETCQEHKLIEIIIQETDSAFVNTLKGKLKLPLKEKNEARRRLSDAEADLETRKWEQRKSEFASSETHQQHESQRRELLQASQWADQSQERG